MCVAWIRSRKGAIVVSPREGATDGPYQPYPTPRPNGRGSDRPLLPHRRCLRAGEPPRSMLRLHKAPLGLRGHRARVVPAAPWGGERALLLARRREVFLPPVSRGRE